MITVIVLLILLSAPCLLGASAGIRFERTLPLVTMGMAVILFLSGIIGSLSAGFFLIVLLSAGSLIFSAVRATRQKKWRETLSGFFTPQFFFFILFSAVILHCYYNMKAIFTDEIGHWVYVVKVMTYLDKLGTSPAAKGVWYASYPPGMALMQYFTAKLDSLIYPGHEFRDWLCFFTYHIYAMSLLLPLSPGSGFKKWWKNTVFYALMSTLLITVFRQEIFTVLIDPFVGLATGAGFIAVLFTEKKDILYRAYMCLICVTLVLAKDVGLASGLAVAAVYFIDTLVVSKRQMRGGPLTASLPFILALCTKGLWALHLRLTDTFIKFNEKVDYLHYAKIFFFGGDETYYQQVADNYKAKLLTGTFFTFFGRPISIGAVFGGSCLAIAILFAVLKLTGNGIRLKAAEISAAVLYFAVYIFNMGAVYTYRFSKHEAFILASLWRYIGMALLPLLMIAAALGLYTVEKLTEKRAERSRSDTVKREFLRRGLTAAVYSLAVISMMVLLFSSEAVESVVTRQYVAVTHNKFLPFMPLSERIKDECSADDRVYLIIQGNHRFSGGSHYKNLVIRELVFPVYIEDDPHSLGSMEGDPSWEDIPYEEWLEMVLENYDYVAVYKTDSQLAEIYGEAFEDGPDIQPGSLYRVNREKRLLELTGGDASGE